MRTPTNETVGSTQSTNAVTPGSTRGPAAVRAKNDSGPPAQGRGDEVQDSPIRTCILSREEGKRGALVRLALAPDGQVLPDVRAKAPGRGAWIGVDRAALEAAISKGRLRGALARAFKTNDFAIPDDLPAQIADALERNALDRLGLESRTGHLLTGSDRIEEAARRGKLHALYHAADAGEDGSRKLAQAWRVGADREGSDLRGLALPVTRPILSLALGRENVVHIGLTDRAAAKRVSDALDRWRHFIGPDPEVGSHQSTTLMGVPEYAPCESASQGASASAISEGPAPDDVQEEAK